VALGWDIFISYAGRDESQAQRLYDLLRADFRVFFAKESIDPGDNFAERIREALLGTPITVVLVSIHSQRAWYQGAENAQAIELARDSEGRKRIVPVYLDGRPKATEWNLFGLNVLHALDANTPGGMIEVARRLSALVLNQPSGTALETASSHVLQTIPMGPMVPGEYVDESLVDAYAERFSMARADLLVDRANAFRKQADGNATVIRKTDVPRIEQVEPIRYWQSVFKEARLHGPRMLAALLLVVNDEGFTPEAQAARRRLLDLLNAGAARSAKM
jgi:hypothetical protein